MESNNIAGGEKRPKYSYDLIIITLLSIIIFIISANYDILETVVGFTHKHEGWQLDELITVLLFLVLVLTFYSLKRWRELVVVNREMEQKNNELRRAFGEIKQLKGIFPICASCKKIRDDKGYWHQVELYIRDHTDAEFSHGLCSECMSKLYPEVADQGDSLKKLNNLGNRGVTNTGK